MHLYTSHNQFLSMGRLSRLDSLAASAGRLSQKIDSFRDLKVGWHYGSGAPSPERVIHDAHQWSEYLSGLGLIDVDAFAGDGGETLLSAMLGGHAVDLIVETDRTLSVAYDRDDKQIWYRSHVPAWTARSYVAFLAGEIWNSFAGSIAIDSTLGKTGLPVWRLGIHQTMVAFQFPSANAFMPLGTHQAARFVNTLAYVI